MAGINIQGSQSISFKRIFNIRQSALSDFSKSAKTGILSRNRLGWGFAEVRQNSLETVPRTQILFSFMCKCKNGGEVAEWLWRHV